MPRAAREGGPVREVRILRGIGFVILATALYVCMNTGVKYLSPYLPTVELLWARSIGHLLFIVALFAPTHGGWRLFVTRKPGLQLLRSLMLLTSSTFFFTAIARVPLADATAISFTSPFIVAVLAGPFLGERVGLAHWIAIAVGFGGALIVIRPGFGGANVYAFLVFGSAICYAVYQTLTRRVGAFDAPETSVTYSGLVGAVVLSAIVPFYWSTPQRLLHWVILAALGLLGGLGHYFVARGFLWGPASILSPFHYVQLVAAAALGYLVFGDVPGATTWIGAVIIIGSGLYIAWRETTRH
jgi:drug/metabolite transporter (DMT)-like permease